MILLKRILLLLLLIVCGLQISCTKQQKPRPNIILLYVDDMGLGDASFTSGQIRPTPNIDRLAAEGKVFTRYYTNAPVCSPSRVAVTTGMYPLRWGINTFLSNKAHNRRCSQEDFLKSEAPTLARALKSAGYSTAHFGKWHMGGGRDVKNAPGIENYGFDEVASTWESPNPDPFLTSSNWIWAPTDSIKRWERTAYFVDKTLDFLKRNKEKPCYVNLWPDDVHSPWVPDEESQENWRQNGFSLSKLQPVIDEFDRQVGRLIEGLIELGMYDNTLLIFTSDNGPAPTFEYARTNGLRGCKNSLYEGGINMPFFVHWPEKVKAGSKDEHSVFSAVDLFPSLCKIAGAQLPSHFHLDGQDVSSIFISDIKLDNTRPIFWEYGRRNPKHSIPKDSLDRSPVLALRRGDWKCLTSFDGTRLELYNLKTDPNEQNNLVASEVEKANAMKSELLEWFHSSDKSALKK